MGPRRRIFVFVLALGLLGFLPNAAHSFQTCDDLCIWAPNLGGIGAKLGNPPALDTGALTDTLLTSVTSVSTSASNDGPSILVIGPGINKSVFPPALQSAISGANTSDGQGYGTLAASAILSVLPYAEITSQQVTANADWTAINMASLASALQAAYDNHATYDAVLLAFPPGAVWDPLSYANVLVSDRFGTGLDALENAVLHNPADTIGPVFGVPLDPTLRATVFAKATREERTAVEKYAAQVIAYRNVIAKLTQLTGTGMPVLAPAGDFPNSAQEAAYNQTIYGLSARPEVITVGASFFHQNATRVSPASGRGPGLGLQPKPDLIAPSDVVTLVPTASTLGIWPDATGQVGGATVAWADTAVASTVCSSPPAGAKCVLQGSSVVSAAIAAANVARLVANGTTKNSPVLRGILWSSSSAAKTYPVPAQPNPDRTAHPWEQGAGAFVSAAGFDAATTPVVLAPADLGEVVWDQSKTVTIQAWAGAAPITGATATLTGFVGPDTTGAAKTLAVATQDAFRVTAVAAATAVTLSVGAADSHFQGGVYGGTLNVASTGGSASVPLTVDQTLPVDFRVTNGFTLQPDGSEGERIENDTLAIFAGTPPSVGIYGAATKFFGTDPTQWFALRWGVTSDAADPSVGKGRITGMPPGFYNFTLIADHSLNGAQTRGRGDNLSPGYAGTTALFLPGQPSCEVEAVPRGPLAPACVDRNPASTTDPGTGLCMAGTPPLNVLVYCGELRLEPGTAASTRAVHHIDSDVARADSEWNSCNVTLPLSGPAWTLLQIAGQADPCEAGTNASVWTLGAGSPECLGPIERTANPDGHARDLTATYAPTASPTTLPVQVLTYRFALPRPNTWTSMDLSFSYVVKNAIIAAVLQTGPDSGGSSFNGIVVASDPHLVLPPGFNTVEKRGSIYQSYGTLSANAMAGTLFVFLIPTSWVTTLEAGGSSTSVGNAAYVALCDVALRVKTFAKQRWTAPTTIAQPSPTPGIPVLRAAMTDQGLHEQIVPANSRERAGWMPEPSPDPLTGAQGDFVDLGAEPEEVQFAATVPKGTTTATRPAALDYPADRFWHSVQTLGQASYLRTLETANANGIPTGEPLADPLTMYDEVLGTTTFRCDEGPTPPPIQDPENPENVNPDYLDYVQNPKYPKWKLCRDWNDARTQPVAQIVGEMPQDMVANGRVLGALPIGLSTLVTGGGNFAFELALKDSLGALDGWTGSYDPVTQLWSDGEFNSAGNHWTWNEALLLDETTRKYVTHFPVSNFYDDSPLLSAASTMTAETGVRVGSDPSTGNPTLTVTLQPAFGPTQQIWTNLNCTSVGGTVVCT